MSKGVFVTSEQVRLTGSPNVARFLAQCLYWSTKCDLVIQRQGWFYKSRDEWQAETWLSRYQQEKARKQLRDMGLLRERKERRNTGIRLWFWLDQALLNTLLNSLADQSINDDTVNNSVELYDSTLTEQSDNCLSDRLDKCKEVEESKYINEYKTIVPEKPLIDSINGVNGTIVLNNINNKESDNSDNYCIENSESTETDAEDKKEAVASFLSDLTDQSDNNINSNPSFECESESIPVFNNNDVANEREIIQADTVQHCANTDAYKACHPFIYQFVKTRILTGFKWSETALNLFLVNGFRCEVIQDALRVFINQHGHSIMNWYQANTPIPVKPLNQADLELAVLISEGGLS